MRVYRVGLTSQYLERQQCRVEGAKKRVAAVAKESCAHTAASRYIATVNSCSQWCETCFCTTKQVSAMPQQTHTHSTRTLVNVPRMYRSRCICGAHLQYIVVVTYVNLVSLALSSLLCDVAHGTWCCSRSLCVALLLALFFHSTYPKSTTSI